MPSETDHLLADKSPAAIEGTTSIPVAILNLSKMLLGAAMLSIPWSLNESSFIPGIIAFIFSTVYTFITCTFVIESCESTAIFEFSHLLRCVHPICEKVAAIIVIYVSLSSCLSYIILIGDFVTEGIRGIDPDVQFDHDRQIYIAVICVLILFPLSLLKEFKSLKVSSMIGNLSNLYCVALTVSFAISKWTSTNGQLPAGFVWNQWDSGILIVTNVGAKAYAAHYAIGPMFQQLKHRSAWRMKWVMFASWFIVTVIYLLFGISGYYCFSVTVDGDVLNDFPAGNPMFTVSRLAMAVSVIGTYPIIFKTLMKTIEDKLFSAEQGATFNFVDHPNIRTLIICIISGVLMVIGIMVENVGSVSSIEGAVTILFLMTLFPILMAWKVPSRLQPIERDEGKYGMVQAEGVMTRSRNGGLRMYRVVVLGVLLFIGLALGIGGIIAQTLLFDAH